MTAELITALIKAQAEIEQPKKNATNPHFKNKFADLGECMDCIREPLRKNGLVLMQLVQGADLVTTLYHTSGQSISSTYPLAPAQPTPQGIGSAITYARRYTYAGVCGIATECKCSLRTSGSDTCRVRGQGAS